MGKKTEEIRRRIQLAEEKKGDKLTKKEKQRIEKKVLLKYRKQNFIKAAFLSIGIVIGAGGHAALTSGNSQNKNTDIEQETTIEQETNTEQETSIEQETEEQNESGKNTFKESLTVDTPINTEQETQKQTNNENKTNEIDFDTMIYQMTLEYNKKYNTYLSTGDIKYIKSNPQYLKISDDGTFVFDYKGMSKYKGIINGNIGDIYILINGKDNTIISSLGKVNDEVTNIDTKFVMNSNRKEYYSSDKKIDLTENKKKEEIEGMYKAFEREFERKFEDTMELE